MNSKALGIHVDSGQGTIFGSGFSILPSRATNGNWWVQAKALMFKHWSAL